ncbi:MAG: TlyA family RNA methyltransferase [Myxococcales bacterium]|nr:TlyA family RNA methyltransferase [Myxococcales bacterium]
MKPRKQRLDVLLVERGLAPSRAKAQALVLAGQVMVGERRVDKPGTLVAGDAELRLKGETLPYVSRGGLKLKAAVDRFELRLEGKVAADIGASTGGFTDVMLQQGARKVYAIDVGYGQLHEKLRRDPRVVSVERVNARYLSERELPELVDAATIDVSFISLRLVLPPVAARLKPGGLVVALVKPQFEVGPEKVGKGGVVRDPKARREAIERIAAFAQGLGLEVRGVMDSPVAGPAGNVEALLVANKPQRDPAGEATAGR